MTSALRPALVLLLGLTVLTGLAYPLAVTGLADLIFPFQAGGSLVRDGSGAVRGSVLIAQAFDGPGYLHPRPSAAGDKGYDAGASSGSNLGPMDPKLRDRVRADALRLAPESSLPIPADAVTASGSGLDPDVSPENAERQAARVAAARGLDIGAVRAIIARRTEGPLLGFLGQPRVNVLLVNRELDRERPLKP